MTFRRVLAWFVIAASCLVQLTPALAQKRSKGRGAIVAPARLVAKPGSVIEIAGMPAYLDEVRLPAASDGLVIVNRLDLETYLLGLNEVPLDWPMEALKAQAVAARTYALWTLGQPPGGSAATYGFDICATVSCQVFSGADVMRLNSDAERWRRAVQETEGEAVLYRGEPILARYHSTSGGRTFANDQIFEDGSFPYLQPVPSTSERGSPLYRWRVRFGFERVETLLKAAGLWAARNGKLRSVEAVGSSEGHHYPDLVFRGRRNLRISAQTFREIAGDRAPSLWPNDYPSRSATSTGRLPETLPSNRYTVVTRHGAMLIIGGGWGHGVGMSQWGAHGMALQGEAYRDILDHYYTGVEIGRFDSPGRIDVGVGWGRSEVIASGSFELLDGRDRPLVRNAIGTWRFEFLGSGAARVVPPKGFGLPLEVGLVKGPEQVEPGRRIKLPLVLSGPAEVRVETEGVERGEPSVVKDAGRSKIRWQAPDEPGLYEVTVVADNGKVTKRDTLQIAVAEVPSPSPSEAPDAAGEPGGVSDASWTLLVGLILVGAALLGIRKVTM